MTYRPVIPQKAWDDLVRFADKCGEEVSRRGVAQPCDKPAVAVRYDDNNEGWPYAVCGYHARKPMVPLPYILKHLNNPKRDTND